VGVRTEKQYKELFTDLKALHFIHITNGTWDASFWLGFDLRKKGLTIPATDILIATAAIESGCMVLHSDHHFDLISKHSNLTAKRV
ncbi:MAG: hypothetical protein AB1546_13815, partial [bacterium]